MLKKSFIVVLLFFIIFTDVSARSVNFREKRGAIYNHIDDAIQDLLEDIWDVIEPLLKLGWDVTIGLVLEPITLPISSIAEAIQVIDRIYNEIKLDFKEGETQAAENFREWFNLNNYGYRSKRSTSTSKHHETNDKSDNKSENNNNSNNNKQSKNNNNEEEEGEESNTGINVAATITHNLIFHIYKLLYGIISESKRASELLEDLAEVITFLKPTWTYACEELMPEIAEELVTLSQSKYASMNTKSKIANLLEAYKILSLLGYLPPLNIP